MTTENLVTIDFESEPVNSENAQLTPIKNLLKSSQRNILDDSDDVIFSDSQEEERNESQPLLGGEHHDTQIIYNQFPSKFKKFHY